MKIGPTVRKAFGSHEKGVSDIYRSIFMSSEDYENWLREKVTPTSILEVGCGEGAISEILNRLYPGALITGIDITANVGRLYAGDPTQVRFIQTSLEHFESTNSDRFDLIILSDVLHHIPKVMRPDFLKVLNTICSRNGTAKLIIKDWEKIYSPIHLLAHFSDRFITGDRIDYMKYSELTSMIQLIFGKNSIKAQGTIKPWRNNIIFLIEPSH